MTENSVCHMTNNEATIITTKKEFFPSFCSVQQTTCNFQTSNTGYYSDQREMKFKQVITVTLSVILCRTKVYGRAATPIRAKLKVAFRGWVFEVVALSLVICKLPLRSYNGSVYTYLHTIVQRN